MSVQWGVAMWGAAPLPGASAGGIHVDVAASLASEGRLEEALEHLDRAVRAYEGTRDVRAADVLLAAAGLQRSLGRQEGAGASVTAARQLYAEAGRYEAVADCDHVAGELQRAQGRPGAAREHFEAAWTVHSADDGLHQAGYAAMAVATTLVEEGAAEAALYVLERAAVMLVDGDEQAHARLAVCRATALVAASRPAEAAELAADARAVFESLGARRDARRADVVLGDALCAAGRHADALAAYGRAATAGSGDHEVMARSHLGKGETLRAMGQPQAAVWALTEAADGYRAAGAPSLAADMDVRRGALLLAAGQPAVALSCFDDAAAYWARVPDDLQSARAQDLAGVALGEMGRTGEALERHASAAEVLAGETDAAAVALHRGRTLMVARRWADAVASLNEAAAHLLAVEAPEGRIAVRATRGLAAVAAGDLDGARRDEAAARAHYRARGDALGLAAVDWCRARVALAEENAAGAHERLVAARRVLVEAGWVVEVARLDRDRARALLLDGDREGARRAAESALAVCERGGLAADVAACEELLGFLGEA